MDAAIALIISGIGALTAALAPVWAQTTSEPVSTWAPASAAAVAVGGLVYVARKMASGELVSVNISEVLAASRRTSEEMLNVMKDGAEREKILLELVRNNTAAMTHLEATLVKAPARARSTAKKRS